MVASLVRYIAPLALAGAAQLAAPLHAELATLKPAGPWNLDVGENRCRLNRLFGEPGNQHLLAFEQYYPSDGAGLIMAGPAFKDFSSGAPTELKLYEGQTPLISAPFTGTVEEFGSAVIYTTLKLDGETPVATNGDEALASGIPALGNPPLEARGITVTQGKDAVTFETGPLASAMGALNRCSEDLIFAWGLDVEQHRTARARVQLTNPKEISGALLDRIPFDRPVRDQQGVIRVRVIVSPEGKGEDCLVLGSTVPAKSAPPICRVMARARFEPARDAQGQPMRSYYATTITYEDRSGS